MISLNGIKIKNNKKIFLINLTLKLSKYHWILSNQFPYILIAFYFCLIFLISLEVSKSYMGFPFFKQFSHNSKKLTTYINLCYYKCDIFILRPLNGTIFHIWWANVSILWDSKKLTILIIFVDNQIFFWYYRTRTTKKYVKGNPLRNLGHAKL